MLICTVPHFNHNFFCHFSTNILMLEEMNITIIVDCLGLYFANIVQETSNTAR